jgi:hypothetical protein
MSRYYDVTVHTEDNNDNMDIFYTYSGEVTLYGGMSEEKYAKKLAKEIWEDYEEFIPLTINMTYLEDLPYESYEFKDEKMYNV